MPAYVRACVRMFLFKSVSFIYLVYMVSSHYTLFLIADVEVGDTPVRCEVHVSLFVRQHHRV